VHRSPTQLQKHAIDFANRNNGAHFPQSQAEKVTIIAATEMMSNGNPVQKLSPVMLGKSPTTETSSLRIKFL
jgi:hypothetical protein